ncbi:MAG: hypothetical protein ACJAZM_000894 [Cyclobacteriaceae bacterium]|jgi:hypothetical protein
MLLFACDSGTKTSSDTADNNWVILAEELGDLDKDGIEEKVIVYHTATETDPFSYTEGQARELQVFKKENNEWQLWYSTRGAVMAASSGGKFPDVFSSMKIERGCIVLVHSWGSAEWTNNLQRYRYQNNQWELIGLTESNNFRDRSIELDFNASTGQAIYKKEDYNTGEVLSEDFNYELKSAVLMDAAPDHGELIEIPEVLVKRFANKEPEVATQIIKDPMPTIKMTDMSFFIGEWTKTAGQYMDQDEKLIIRRENDTDEYIGQLGSQPVYLGFDEELGHITGQYNGGKFMMRAVSVNPDMLSLSDDGQNGHYDPIKNEEYTKDSGAFSPLEWISVDGCEIPKAAVKGGQEPGRDLVICRADYAGGKHPGKVVDCGCNIGYGGNEVSVTKYEVLAGTAEIRWVDAVGPDGPKFNTGTGGTYDDNGLKFTVIADRSTQSSSSEAFYAFQGGWEGNGSPLLVCNSKYLLDGEQSNSNTSNVNGTHPGKVVGGCCNFGYAGSEIQGCNEFKIMVVKGQIRALNTGQKIGLVDNDIPDPSKSISLKFQELTLKAELEETWNESGYFDKVHDDSISVELGLGSVISGQVFQLELSNELSKVVIFQNYETSMTIMDEGPHIDLTKWKHHKSEWKQLQLENSLFSPLKYSNADKDRFPDVTTEEIIEAVRDELNDEDNKWTEIAKQCENAKSYPCGVSISQINLRVELTMKNGSTSNKYILFEVPMGD